MASLDMDSSSDLEGIIRAIASYYTQKSTLSLFAMQDEINRSINGVTDIERQTHESVQQMVASGTLGKRRRLSFAKGGGAGGVGGVDFVARPIREEFKGPIYDDVTFQKTFRLPRDSFARLLDSIKSNLATNPPAGLANIPNRRLSPERQLMAGVYRLAQGGYLTTPAKIFGIARPTISKVQARVLKSIIEVEGPRRHLWPQGSALEALVRAVRSKGGMGGWEG